LRNGILACGSLRVNCNHENRPTGLACAERKPDRRRAQLRRGARARRTGDDASSRIWGGGRGSSQGRADRSGVKRSFAPPVPNAEPNSAEGRRKECRREGLGEAGGGNKPDRRRSSAGDGGRGALAQGRGSAARRRREAGEDGRCACHGREKWKRRRGGLPPAYIDPRRWARSEIVRDAVLAWRVRQHFDRAAGGARRAPAQGAASVWRSFRLTRRWLTTSHCHVGSSLLARREQRGMGPLLRWHVELCVQWFFRVMLGFMLVCVCFFRSAVVVFNDGCCSATLVL
jgi:hypothetical protein